MHCPATFLEKQPAAPALHHLKHKNYYNTAAAGCPTTANHRPSRKYLFCVQHYPRQPSEKVAAFLKMRKCALPTPPPLLPLCAALFFAYIIIFAPCSSLLLRRPSLRCACAL